MKIVLQSLYSNGFSLKPYLKFFVFYILVICVHTFLAACSTISHPFCVYSSSSVYMKLTWIWLQWIKTLSSKTLVKPLSEWLNAIWQLHSLYGRVKIMHHANGTRLKTSLFDVQSAQTYLFTELRKASDFNLKHFKTKNRNLNKRHFGMCR